MTTALRPLSTGELLDRTFSLYRSHFGLFVSIFALPHLVVLAVQLLQVIDQRSYGRMPNFLATMLWFVAIAFVGLIMASASQAAAVIAVSELYLDRPARIMDSFVRVKGHLLGVVSISIIMGLGIGAGTMVLLVPGILLAIAISGGLAGLAGAIEIAGVNYRLYQDISPGYGFEGIAVALLANNNQLAAIASGVLFAVLRSGSELMQMSAQVPQVLVFVIQGFCILSVAAFAVLRRSAPRSAP